MIVDYITLGYYFKSLGKNYTDRLDYHTTTFRKIANHALLSETEIFITNFKVGLKKYLNKNKNL